MFHHAFDPLTIQEETAFKATQESGWLNTVAATGASVYGGPAGAAAYAAWQTYRISGGNAELAIRAGIISGLTSAAMGGSDGKGGLAGITATSTQEIVQKAVLAGAIGGLAIAAGGGSSDDIRDGFLMGGGMMLIQEGYKGYTGHPLDAQGARGLPYCMSEIDASCIPLQDAFIKDEQGNVIGYDPSKLDPNRPHVGLQAQMSPNATKPLLLEVKAPTPVLSDQSAFMVGVAKVPGMNAMALFHDTWAVNWKMEVIPGATQLSIFPAVAVTYWGTGSELNKAIIKTITSETQSADRSGYIADSIAFTRSLERDSTQSFKGIVLASTSESTTDSIGSAYHKSAPIGSVLTVTNIVNGKSTKVVVKGNLQADTNAVSMKLSPDAIKTLGPGSTSFWVKVD